MRLQNLAALAAFFFTTSAMAGSTFFEESNPAKMTKAENSFNPVPSHVVPIVCQDPAADPCAPASCTTEFTGLAGSNFNNADRWNWHLWACTPGDNVALEVNRTTPCMDVVLVVCEGDLCSGSDTAGADGFTCPTGVTTLAAADDNNGEACADGPFADPRVEFVCPPGGILTLAIYDFLGQRNGCVPEYEIATEATDDSCLDPTGTTCDLGPIEAKLDVIEPKLDRIETNTNTIITTTNDIETAVGVLEGKADRSEGKLDVVEGKADRAEGKLDVLEGKADRAEGKLDVLEGKADRAEGKLDVLEGKADRAEGKLDRLEGKADRAEGKLDRLEGKADRAEGKLDRLEGKADRAEGKLDRLEGKMDLLPCEILRLIGQIPGHELPTTHPCFLP